MRRWETYMVVIIFGIGLTYRPTIALDESYLETSRLTRGNQYKFQASVASRKLAEDEDYMFDLASYSVRFGQCQHVKMYDDDLAQDQDSTEVFTMKHFVVYRLCSSDSCDTCKENYGEYVTEVDDYLNEIVEYNKDQFENMCKNCDENCGDDDGSQYCSHCAEKCEKYNDIEDNGQIDASEYIECQEIDQGDDDDGANQLYVGPRCSSDGTQIRLGVFSDENCWEPYDADLEELLGSEIVYYFMRNAYSVTGCTSCKEQDGNDEDDGDNVAEICENLYDVAAKCETKHGFDNGLASVNGYENQIQNEYDACTFIDSLVWNSYDEEGEIAYEKVQDVILREITSLQKVMFSFLGLVTLGVGSYAYYLHKQIIGTFKIDLSCQGQIT